VLYIVSYLLAAAGLAAWYFYRPAGYAIFALGGVAIAALVFINSKYNRCPDCWHLIRVRYFSSVQKCDTCGRLVDLSEQTK
jgi:hypothetical protein